MTVKDGVVPRVLLGPDRWDESSRSASLRSAIMSVAVVVGLFTVSWDRLANITVGGYNVKLPALAFSIAAVFAIPLLRRPIASGRSALLRAAMVVTVTMIGVLVLATLLSDRPVAGAVQIVAVLTGAVAPALALVTVVSSTDRLRWALRWFIAGAVFSCTFGLYQLIAFYAGLPQLVEYTGLGLDGRTARIAAFNYEPAYFVNFVVLAAGASAVLALLDGRRLGWLPVIGFTVILVLANVRALLFLIPVLLVLLALRWRSNRSLLLRAVVVGAVVLVLNSVGTTVVVDLSTATERPVIVATGAPTRQAPSSGSPSTTAVESPEVPQVPTEVPASTAPPPPDALNPNEQSSNAPRLELYRAVIAAIADRPLLGVGPGNLRAALARVGYSGSDPAAQVIANNVWLQALADGGIVLVLLEIVVVVLVVLVLLRRSMERMQPLAAAWLAVIGVSGMLTSFFFDIKMWVVLGLLFAATSVVRTPMVPAKRH